MFSVNDFSQWLERNTNLSDNSRYKYSHAVATISNEMQQEQVLCEDLFALSAVQLDIFIPLILNNPAFIKKNKTGNNMYSTALKHYRMYRAANISTLTDEEIKRTIASYDSLNTTERTALVKARVGQGVFKERLLKKYNSSCIMTGISSPKLLIASHIKPWAVSNNEERLSGENGLLLSPTYDKLFDYGLITFSDSGSLIISSQLPKSDIDKLHISNHNIYELKASSIMLRNLEYHRDIIFVK